MIAFHLRFDDFPFKTCFFHLRFGDVFHLSFGDCPLDTGGSGAAVEGVSNLPSGDSAALSDEPECPLRGCSNGQCDHKQGGMEGWKRHTGGIANCGGNTGGKRHFRRESRRNSHYSAGILAGRKAHSAGTKSLSGTENFPAGRDSRRSSLLLPLTREHGGEHHREASVR